MGVAQSMDPETEKTWKSLVYNVNISSSDVQQFYNSWAVQYDQDQVKLRTGADHLAEALVEALEQSELNKHEVSILDVACGTGLVADSLIKKGFKNHWAGLLCGNAGS